LAQLVVIVAYVVFLPAESSLIAPYVEPYPLWGMVLERAVMVLTLIWVTNLYNFMDGINGITGTETLSLGLGAGCVCIVAGFWTPDTGLPIFLYPAWFLCAAMAGFLIFNFGKAKIFLGDVGSISTGLAMGSAMIMLSATGYWAAGLILPLYYVVDATYTLFKRYRRGENIFQPHKQHFYQQSTQRGRSHAGTCYWILGCNIGLVVIASASIVVAQQSAGSENANALQARILLSQGGALLLALLWCGVCIRGMLSVDAIQQEDA
jgi:UDP-N-acetylmuramyl pentapeptide phosphotransferase/UDP-N-acetylglucosamine-1-phosphate transferase